MPTIMLRNGISGARFRAMNDSYAMPILILATPIMSITCVGLIAPLSGVFQGGSVPISGGGPPVDRGR